MLEVADGLADALAAETVEAPEDEQVELSVFGRFEDGVEAGTLAPLLPARFVVDVFAGELVPLFSGEAT